MNQKKLVKKSKSRNIMYFALLGVEIAFIWFFWNTMTRCHAVGISCAPIKAYLSLLALTLLVVQLLILIVYERRQKTRSPFALETNQKKWTYLGIVILLVLTPILLILIL